MNVAVLLSIELLHASVNFVLNEYAALISSSCLTAPTSMAKVVLRKNTIREGGLSCGIILTINRWKCADGAYGF